MNIEQCQHGPREREFIRVPLRAERHVLGLMWLRWLEEGEGGPMMDWLLEHGYSDAEHLEELWPMTLRYHLLDGHPTRLGRDRCQAVRAVVCELSTRNP